MPGSSALPRWWCPAAKSPAAGQPPIERVVAGELVGRLATSPRGSHGFGYDPIFVPEGDTRTTAEMDPAEKDAISHRGRAFRALAAVISEILGPGGADSSNRP